MSTPEPTTDDDLATVASWTRGGTSLVNRQDVSVRLATEVIRLRSDYALLLGARSWPAKHTEPPEQAATIAAPASPAAPALSGCVCPPTAEQTCKGWTCPRRELRIAP